MTFRIDFFNNTYTHFTDQVLKDIREETFIRDIGQNSWLSAEEYDHFISWLNISPGNHILEVASGSGGPALYLAEKMECYVTGIDMNENGIIESAHNALRSNQTNKVNFTLADANRSLPYTDNLFDALLCIDSMNHFPNRLRVLKEWFRILCPGKRALFTDPVVITGPVTNDELALRSIIGQFLFVPRHLNEELIDEAGFQLVKQEDVTENVALISSRWLQARQRHKNDLVKIEGEERFDGLQKFFAAVYRLSNERKLSRIVYLVEKN